MTPSGEGAAQHVRLDRVTRDRVPLVLNGPPGATGFGDRALSA